MIIQLKENIKVAAVAAFSFVRAHYPDEKLCGYALYSDADAITVCPSVNTVGNLQKHLAEGFPEDAEYFRWSPAEWMYEYVGAENFAEISEMLSDLQRGITDPDEFSRFKQTVYESAVVALEELRAENFFNDLGAEGVVVFAISDGDSPGRVEWISRLNSADLAARYEGWISE